MASVRFIVSTCICITFAVGFSAIASAAAYKSDSHTLQISQISSGFEMASAENERGLFGIFNRKGDNSKASPLFLDNPDSNKKSSSKSKNRVYKLDKKTYMVDRNSSGSLSPVELSIAKTKEQNQANFAIANAEADKRAQQKALQYEAKLAAKRQRNQQKQQQRASQGQGGQNNTSTTKKQYIYRPYTPKSNGAADNKYIYNSQ